MLEVCVRDEMAQDSYSYSLHPDAFKECIIYSMEKYDRSGYQFSQDDFKAILEELQKKE